MDYQKYHIDYFTSTVDYSEAMSIKLNETIAKYHWTKLRYFKEGNLILVRDRKEGIDYLIKLMEDGRPMSAEEKLKAGKYGRQNYVAKYVIIDKDNKPSKFKTRYIPARVKSEILEKFDYKCQGSNEIMGGTLKETLPKFKCNISFRNKRFKPEFDHINEFSVKGGLTIEENIVPLCKGCHAMKGAFFKRDLVNMLSEVKNSPNVI